MIPKLPYELIADAYTAFNARDIDAILTIMHPEVEWQNAMEGGFIYGHEALRAYWTRQWGMIDPHIEPVHFSMDADGCIRVQGYQTLHNLEGVLVLELMMLHIFTIQDGLVSKMEVQPF